MGKEGGDHGAAASSSGSSEGGDDDDDEPIEAYEKRMRARFQSAAAAAADDCGLESSGFDLEWLSVLVDWGADGVFAGKVARYAPRTHATTPWLFSYEDGEKVRALCSFYALCLCPCFAAGLAPPLHA